MPTKNKQTISIIPPAVLLGAYAAGIFPMANPGHGGIDWFSPDPRAIIPLDAFTITRSLRQKIRKHIFQVRVDTSFEAVIRACAEREETWISEGIVQSYLHLFTLGFAHSVETWQEGELAGGLYGVTLGAAFFGESMFSRRTDASKVALVHLVERLREREFELLDTQFTTPHLEQFGTIEIPREEYLERLGRAVEKERRFG